MIVGTYADSTNTDHGFLYSDGMKDSAGIKLACVYFGAVLIPGRLS